MSDCDATHDEMYIRLDDPPPCMRCGGQAMLLVRFSNAWMNGSGKNVEGIREAVLCPACNCGKPEAAALLALLTVDEKIEIDNMERLGGLVAAWVESLRQESVDLEALNNQYEQWRLAEL